MKNVGLVVPALFFAIGAYLLISGITGDENMTVFAGSVTMRSKFGILLGGVGVVAGIAVAFEMLSKARPRAAVKPISGR